MLENSVFMTTLEMEISTFDRKLLNYTSIYFRKSESNILEIQLSKLFYFFYTKLKK